MTHNTKIIIAAILGVTLGALMGIFFTKDQIKKPEKSNLYSQDDTLINSLNTLDTISWGNESANDLFAIIKSDNIDLFKSESWKRLNDDDVIPYRNTPAGPGHPVFELGADNLARQFQNWNNIHEEILVSENNSFPRPVKSWVLEDWALRTLLSDENVDGIRIHLGRIDTIMFDPSVGQNVPTHINTLTYCAVDKKGKSRFDNLFDDGKHSIYEYVLPCPDNCNGDVGKTIGY